MTKYNEAALRLKEALDLKLHIQAVKLIEDPAQVPEDVAHARETYGHLSLCQAFALTKRQGRTLYTDKTSEWCWAPVVGLGYADCSPGTKSFESISRLMGIEDPEKSYRFFADFPRLPLGKYQGVLLAPATEAAFEPDVLLINCDNNFQLRTLLSAVKFKSGKMLEVQLDPVDSCIHTLVSCFIKKDYTVAIPDPGEQERALTDRNELIMAVPAEKLDDLMAGLEFISFIHMGYHDMQAALSFDFPRPPFYNEAFEEWGLETGSEWAGHGK